MSPPLFNTTYVTFGLPVGQPLLPVHSSCLLLPCALHSNLTLGATVTWVDLGLGI